MSAPVPAGTPSAAPSSAGTPSAVAPWRADDRAARTPRQWVTLALGAVLLAALCLVAAWWQWDRYELHRSQADQLASAYQAAPVPAAELLPAPGAPLPADDVWRSVTAHGRYEADRTVLLRNRPVDGEAVFHVLVPFVVDAPGTPQDGVVLVVDRGTVPLANTNADEPGSVPGPPSGEVTVTVRLRADEPVTPRGAPAGQVQAISTPMVLAAAPGGAGWAQGRTTGAYGVLRSETPAPSTPVDALPEPDGADPGVNLSYTIQWCIFAAGLVGGYMVLWRRERGPRLTAGDLIAASDDPQTARSRRPAKPAAERRAHRPSHEDEEDALLDALGVDVRPPAQGTTPQPGAAAGDDDRSTLPRRPAGRYGA